jgi:hypothetical protein
MIREAIQSRYGALRAINIAHHSAVLRHLSRAALMKEARSLGLMRGQTLVADSEDELTMPSIWRSTPPGRGARARSTATPGRPAWRPARTRRGCSMRCAPRGSRSGGSSESTRRRV